MRVYVYRDERMRVYMRAYVACVCTGVKKSSVADVGVFFIDMIKP